MGNTYGYDREGFLAEFFPEGADRAEVEAGAAALVSVSRAHRLAETTAANASWPADQGAYDRHGVR